MSADESQTMTPAEFRAWAKTQLRPVAIHDEAHRLSLLARNKCEDLLETAIREKRDLLASEQRASDAAKAEAREFEEIMFEAKRAAESYVAGRNLLNTGGSATARGSLKYEGTYRPDVAEVSFFRDLMNHRQSPEAQERLHTNQREAIESRTVTTADPGAAGFIPPIYLANAWAELARPARPFANVVPKWPMPDTGTSVTVPKVQSGVTVAVQAAELNSVSSTDIDSQTVTANIVTIAGQNDTSRQALERSLPGLDQVIFDDLQAAYDTQIDTQLLSGSGSSGQHLGIRNVSGKLTVSYTDGTPTGAELLPKVYDAIQQVATNRFRAADTIVMHPRRAAWLGKELSSTFPLFQQGNLMQAAGTQDGGFLTSFGGLRVVLDPNIGTAYGTGTNEDEIYVLHMGDYMFAESPMYVKVFEDVLSSTLAVRLQLYAYSFWVPHRQAKSTAVISGTGLGGASF